MLLKKPRFWDYKYISFLAIVLSPLSFFVNIFNYIKLKISKKKNKERMTENSLIYRVIGKKNV